jgi:uracil-DNA glycosylase
MAKYNIHESWYPLFEKWSTQLESLLEDVYNPVNKIPTFPEREQVFKVFKSPVPEIKCVLLGQDCYHSAGQAMGLAFSVPPNIKIPPSLVNIFKELQIEFPERGYVFTNGNISLRAAREGIFLLNAALSVRQAAPLSHIKRWEAFTDDVIRFILENNSNCIFLLLGNYAKDKHKIISKICQDGDSRIIKSVHPSPLSAHAGFFNSGIFTQVENKLGCIINWQN